MGGMSAQDERGLEEQLVPDAPAAALVQKAYEVAAEFEKSRQGRATEPLRPAEVTSGQEG